MNSVIQRAKSLFNFENHRPNCTCELGKVKSVSKKRLRYSMCDVCSEKLYSKGLLTSSSSCSNSNSSDTTTYSGSDST